MRRAGAVGTTAVSARPGAGDGKRGYALAGAVAGFAFLLALFPLQCHDIWWHLANGREIASGRGVPRTNLYSFTHPDYPVTPTHWLFGLGAYLVHRAAGPTGLVVAKAFLLAAAFLLSYVLARKAGAPDAWAAVTVAVAALASRQRFLERPHLFTMLGLVVFALVIHEYRKGRSRTIWALPPLAALWANLHAGCLFGVGLVAIEAAGEAVSWLRAASRGGAVGTTAVSAHPGADADRARSHRAASLRLAGAALACALAVMAAPAGWRVYSYNLWHVGLGRVVELVEFRTPTPWDDPWFYLLLASGAAALALDRRKARAAEALVFAAFGILAVYAVRGVPNFALVAAPIVAPRLSRGWNALRIRERTAGVVAAADRIPNWALWAVLALLPFSGHVFGGPLRAFRIGPGVRQGFFPERAAGFVLRELPRARVLNDLAAGGYLAWRRYPEGRVFVDGRTNAYPPGLFRTLYGHASRARSAMRRDIPELASFDGEESAPKDRASPERAYLRAELEDTLASVAARYSLDAMLLYFYRGANRFWAGVDLDRWAVVHSERAALVLVKRGGRHAGVIRRFEKRLGAEGEAYLSRRLAVRGSEFVLRAGAAADRALRAEPASEREVFRPRRRAALLLRRANGLRLRGRPAEAVEDYRRVLEIDPAGAQARLNLGFALLGSGRPEDAREEFERLLGGRRGPVGTTSLTGRRGPVGTTSLTGRRGKLRMRHYAVYGLAETLRALGELRAALGFYEEFLASGEGRDADRRKARRAVEEIEARLARPPSD